MNKEEKIQITKDKLIEATWQLMEELDDPMQVTSRQIADRAGTKPSMINYCFGSREDLIYNVFQAQYMNFLKKKNVEKILAANLPPKELLKELHFLVASYLVDNFKFTKAITNFVIFKRDLGPASFSLKHVIAHYNGTKTEEECKLIAYELSTMMQLIIYRKDDIKKDFGINLDNKKELKKYIDLRVDLLLRD